MGKKGLVSKISRYLSWRMAAAVVIIQGAMLLTLWVTPTWTPPRVKFFELLWAWMHQPTFYPFIALLIGAPILTVLASLRPGYHRLCLSVSWALFALVIMGHFNDRVVAMTRVLWWQVAG